jgi:hypothetical protein
MCITGEDTGAYISIDGVSLIPVGKLGKTSQSIHAFLSHVISIAIVWCPAGQSSPLNLLARGQGEPHVVG